MLNSEAPPNYASVEDGSGTSANAEPPRRSWGRILAATLACVALATIAVSGVVQLRKQATVTAFPGEAGTLYAQCRASDPPCDSGLYCAGSGRCLVLEPGTVNAPCRDSGQPCDSPLYCQEWGQYAGLCCRGGDKMHSDSCQCGGYFAVCKKDDDCCGAGERDGSRCLPQYDLVSSPFKYRCVD